MRRSFTLLMMAICSFHTMNAQVFTENFTATWNPATQGWVTLNLSSPVGTSTVLQGNPAVFPAFNGAMNDYVAMNYLSTTSNGVGGISTWLITPSLSISNGYVLEFATRRTTSTYPDRLQVRMSPTDNTVIPTGTTSIGTYTTLMLDINPNLTTATSSVVTGNVVSGYPQSWAFYTLEVTGLTGTVSGRFAFRYFVDNAGGGSSATNSDYIGIDAVKIHSPCGATVPSYTTCSGLSTTIAAIGALPATTFSWSTGSTASSIVVNPSSTTVYTFYPLNGATPCGTSQTSTITIASNLVVSVNASTTTICSGNPVTLIASAPANTYSWNTGANTAAITVTPGVTTTYSVAALNGFCFGGNTITINVNASPGLSVSLSPTAICVGGGSITINASGASTYTYNGNSNNPQTIATPGAGGIYNFALLGSGSNGCISAGIVTFTVSDLPLVTASTGNTLVCVDNVITINGGGATSYTWSGAATSTNASFSYTTGATAGPQTFSVIGFDGATGCSNTATLTVSVGLCTGIETINGNILGVSIFPNPFNNELSISGIEGSVEIYNALGQKVLSSSINKDQTLNTSEFPKGAYVLRVNNKEGEIIRNIKLIKN